MRQDDLFILGCGIIAVGLAIWGLWRSPEHSPPRPHVAQELNVDPDLKRITELNPYMRSER